MRAADLHTGGGFGRAAGFVDVVDEGEDVPQPTMARALSRPTITAAAQDRVSGLLHDARAGDPASPVSGGLSAVLENMITMVHAFLEDGVVTETYRAGRTHRCDRIGATPAARARCSGMRPARHLIAIAPLLVLAAFAWAAASASAATEVLLHPRWHVVARQVQAVETDGRYVVTDGLGPQPGLRLIDDRSGRTTFVREPFCGRNPSSPYAVGGGWLLASACGAYPSGADGLYSIAAKRWTPFPRASDTYPLDIGRQWVEGSTLDSEQCTEHCGYHFTFTNIASGQVRTLGGWHPGATTVPDLSSSGLAIRLCAPLRVPQGVPEDSSELRNAPGRIAFGGLFGVAVYPGHAAEPYGTGNLVLQRCGSQRHRVLLSGVQPAPAFAINRGAVMWLNGVTPVLHGLFLPSLRSFRISVAGADQVWVTSRTLYVRSQGRNGNVLLATPAPASASVRQR